MNGSVSNARALVIPPPKLSVAKHSHIFPSWQLLKKLKKDGKELGNCFSPVSRTIYCKQLDPSVRQKLGTVLAMAQHTTRRGNLHGVLVKSVVLTLALLVSWTRWSP